MNAAAAPLATIEDLSDIENVTDDDQYVEIAKEDIVISARHSASRIRSISEGSFIFMQISRKIVGLENS